MGNLIADNNLGVLKGDAVIPTFDYIVKTINCVEEDRQASMKVGDWIGGEIGFGMMVSYEVEYEIYSNTCAIRLRVTYVEDRFFNTPRL
jgi:hypothetical protein